MLLCVFDRTAFMSKQKLLAITAPAEAGDKRLDQFLVSHLPNISRARIQQLISERKVLVNDLESKPSLRLRGGERITLLDRKSTRLNSSHSQISYAVFCLKKKKKTIR